ncbi:TPA: glycosyltransferase [Bacillus paranthracis]
MRVLFCHDGPLRVDEFHNYYGTAHNDKTFIRYYNIADELSVAMRVNTIQKEEAEQYLSKITVSPIKVIKCPNMSSIKGMLFNKQKTVSVLEDAIIESDYIVARLPSVIGSIAVDIAKKHRKPYLVEVVACPWDAFWNHSIKGKLVAPFMYYATKKLVRDADYSIYVTNEFLQNRYPTKGKSVSCSNVALKEFDDKILEDRLQKIQNMSGNRKIVIGTTGAVDVKYKGQRYIIQALGELKKKGNTNFIYQLVGGGNQEYLKSIAKKYNVLDQVTFLGAMPHDKVFGWLETIDLYVQPSRQEGLPRALIEAMSAGVPAFGAKTAGIPELLDKEFIFSNTRSNIDEICNILLSFGQNTLIEQAKRNYLESKKYEKSIIESRRTQFFKLFKDIK